VNMNKFITYYIDLSYDVIYFYIDLCIYFILFIYIQIMYTLYEILYDWFQYVDNSNNNIIINY